MTEHEPTDEDEDESKIETVEDAWKIISKQMDERDYEDIDVEKYRK